MVDTRNSEMSATEIYASTLWSNLQNYWQGFAQQVQAAQAQQLAATTTTASTATASPTTDLSSILPYAAAGAGLLLVVSLAHRHKRSGS
jgi:hypothetical protein